MYSFSDNEKRVMAPKRLNLQNSVEFGFYSNRIMGIAIDISQIENPVQALLSDLGKIKYVNDFTGFDPNHEIIYQETLRIFSN